jgi:hypothetical protein
MEASRKPDVLVHMHKSGDIYTHDILSKGVHLSLTVKRLSYVLQSEGLQKANDDAKDTSDSQKNPLVSFEDGMDNVLKFNGGDARKTPAECLLDVHNLVHVALDFFRVLGEDLQK